MPRHMCVGPRGGAEVEPESDAVLTIDELADYLKISKSTIYKLAQDRRVPAQKVGKHWRFRKAAIDRWLDAAEVRYDEGGEICE